jgi:hypothetical protein
VRASLEHDEDHLFSLVREMLQSEERRKAVLSLSSDSVEPLMELLQSVYAVPFTLIILLMDTQFLGNATTRFHADPELLHISQRLIVDLGRISGALPSSLLIKGVTLTSNTAVTGGAFADIYRGRYQGRCVALKRLRVWESQDRHTSHCV